MFTKRLIWSALLLTLVLATGLRLHKLDAQSLWNDEGNTARLVERSIPLIIEGAAGDIHPPGYYLLLHAWRGVTGETEFALRAYSALCGILTVAVAAAIGKRAGGWATALGAAFFVALHPLAVYYSQEARMYAQLGLVSALTLWAAGGLVKSRKLQVTSYKSNVESYASRVGELLLDALVYILPLTFAITLGLYTQYAYIFALLGLNVAFGVYWLTRQPWNWRLLRLWIGAHALGGLLFLPWAPIALRASGWRPPDLAAAQAFQALTRALCVGLTLPDTAGAYIMPVVALLLVLAVLTHSKQAFIKWAALGMALVPPTLILTLGIYRSAYLKFLMAAVAPLGVILALPLNAQKQRAAPLRRCAAIVFLFALIPTQITALQNLYNNPTYARDDYRAIAARITAEGQPGDAIILSAPNQWEVFTYYYRGPLPVYPAPYRPTPEQAAAWLDSTLPQYTRGFVLFWGDTESDPEQLIESRLAQRAYKAGDTWMSSIRLALYGRGDLPETPLIPSAYELGAAIMLLGHSVPTHPFHGGSVVPVTLFWQAITVPEQRYKVFIHLLDADGVLRAQTDSEPGGGLNPTTQWPVDQLIADRYGVLLPPDIVAGEYTLHVGMYTLAGERLPVIQKGQALGDTVLLARIRMVNGEW